MVEVEQTFDLLPLLVQRCFFFFNVFDCVVEFLVLVVKESPLFGEFFLHLGVLLLFFAQEFLHLLVLVD